MKSGLYKLVTVLLITIEMNSFYFYLTQGEEMCFYGMAFKRSVTSVHYNFLEGMKNKNTGESIKVEMKVYDQALNVIHQTTIQQLKPKDSTGEIDFMSNVNGEIKICFATDTYHWIGENAKLKMELE